MNSDFKRRNSSGKSRGTLRCHKLESPSVAAALWQALQIRKNCKQTEQFYFMPMSKAMPVILGLTNYIGLEQPDNIDCSLGYRRALKRCPLVWYRDYLEPMHRVAIRRIPNTPHVIIISIKIITCSWGQYFWKECNSRLTQLLWRNECFTQHVRCHWGVEKPIYSH